MSCTRHDRELLFTLQLNQRASIQRYYRMVITANDQQGGRLYACQSRTSKIRAAPARNAPAISMVRKGIILPFDHERGRWYRVLTPCELSGWIRSTDVSLISPATRRAC